MKGQRQEKRFLLIRYISRFTLKARQAVIPYKQMGCVCKEIFFSRRFQRTFPSEINPVWRVDGSSQELHAHNVSLTDLFLFPAKQSGRSVSNVHASTMCFYSRYTYTYTSKKQSLSSIHVHMFVFLYVYLKTVNRRVQIFYNAGRLAMSFNLRHFLQFHFHSGKVP